MTVVLCPSSSSTSGEHHEAVQYAVSSAACSIAIFDICLMLRRLWPSYPRSRRDLKTAASRGLQSLLPRLIPALQRVRSPQLLPREILAYHPSAALSESPTPLPVRRTPRQISLLLSRPRVITRRSMSASTDSRSFKYVISARLMSEKRLSVMRWPAVLCRKLLTTS